MENSDVDLETTGDDLAALALPNIGGGTDVSITGNGAVGGGTDTSTRGAFVKLIFG